MFRASFAALVLLLAAGTAIAADPPRANTVEMQAEAQREVANDLLNATLYVELSDANPAALANGLNKAIGEALRIAREYKSVRVRSGANQTYPVYSRPGALQGWRGRAEIRLESREFDAATALIGRLQSSLQLGGLHFSVAADSRRVVENELIAEAIGAFRARAEIVRGALGGRAYRIQRLSLNNNSFMPQPRAMAARAAVASPEVMAPAVEAGVSTVSVTVAGAIEVLD